MQKFQYFDNKKFTRDDKTGYYLNSTMRKRMHVYVWEYYNGAIPKGYEIHHKDCDKSNNNISNLEMLISSKHKALHSQLLTAEERERRRKNLNDNARPKAVEWHKSEQGKIWHKEHYNHTKDKLHKKVQKPCLNCGKLFISENGRYCSNACKSAYRRKQGKDLETRICAICGDEFKTNKYQSAKTCSQSCANKLRHKNESKKSNENQSNSKSI